MLALERAVNGIKCAARAALHGVLLLPLPLFWDALEELDWTLLEADEGSIRETHFSAAAFAYLRLRNMAHFSEAHLQLLEQFAAPRQGVAPTTRPHWNLF